MANELQSLSRIFQNRLFRIPDYQRGYAWQQEQLVDFWDDLVNLQADKNHYTGLLSLKPLKTSEIKSWGNDLWMVEKGYSPCHIVDGQQRLTTFVILVNEIVEFVKTTPEYKADPSSIVLGFDTLDGIVTKYICQRRPPHNQIITYLFSYENDNPSAEYLRYKIFGEEFSGTIAETYYTKNLKFAKQFFADNLAALYKDNENGIEAIDKLYKKLTLHLQFNIHEIDDDYDVFVAFETMNNRGKKLTNLELLKNRLIYLTTLYSDTAFDEMEKANLRAEINEAWKDVYYQLGRNIRTPLSDDEYLRAHWIIYFMYSRNKGDDYIKYLLSKFSAKNIYEKEPVTFEEVTDNTSVTNDPDAVDLDNSQDDEYSDEDEQELFSKLKPSEISNYVRSLKDTAKYWYDSFFPYESTELSKDEKIWVDRLNRIGIGHFRPVVTAIIANKKTAPEIKVEALKSIERFIFVCFRMGGFNASYKSSDYYRSARAIYVGEKPIEAIAKELNATVAADSQYAISNFSTKVEKWFTDEKGFYDWGTLRYFMYEYEFILKEQTGTEKITWEMFTKSEKDKVSIEHILPQKPTKYYWRNMFRQYSDSEITQLSCALGNLLPLSLSINIALQNDSFPDKKHAKPSANGRRGYEDGSHSEIEVAKNDDWSAQHIYARSKKLIDFLQSRWNITLTEDQEKKLIFVNFASEERDPIPELTEETSIIQSTDSTDSKPAKSGTAEVLKEWCEEQDKKGLIHFSHEHSNNTYIRFTTDGMNKIIPRQKGLKSGWNSPDFYFYEINNHKDYFRMFLSISSTNAPKPLMDEFNKLIEFYKPRRTNSDWEWKRIHSTDAVHYSDDITKEQIFAQLDKMLSEMLALEAELIVTRPE